LTTPLDETPASESTPVTPEIAATDPRRQFELSAERLKALAETQRLQIISLLLSGPKRVGDLAAKIGHEMAKVSHHLGVLRQSHLVTATKCGRFVEYALHPDTRIERQGARDELVIDLGLIHFTLPVSSPDPITGSEVSG
jgi:DNA-binding transcriptional ArsR family regulator